MFQSNRTHVGCFALHGLLTFPGQRCSWQLRLRLRVDSLKAGTALIRLGLPARRASFLLVNHIDCATNRYPHQDGITFTPAPRVLQ